MGLFKTLLPLASLLVISSAATPISGCSWPTDQGAQCLQSGQLCDIHASKCCPGLTCQLIPYSDPALSQCT
jgi:hypothetical protein